MQLVADSKALRVIDNNDTKTLRWKGAIDNVMFNVECLANAAPGAVSCRANIFVLGTRVAVVHFSVTIAARAAVTMDDAKAALDAALASATADKECAVVLGSS